jgi:hypothetical protein
MILKQIFENGTILINFDKNFLNLIKFEKKSCQIKKIVFIDLWKKI